LGKDAAYGNTIGCGCGLGNYPQLQRVSGCPGGGGFSSFVANAPHTRHVRGKLRIAATLCIVKS